jgi:hypothetical protein
MKTAVLERSNEPLVDREIPAAIPGSDEALV